MDEFDILEPHEVYACLADPMRKERIYIEGDVVISRSPTHHPGDMQYARAIGRPPAGSPLLSLVNCIVFPQKGTRSLPSMLAGGGARCGLLTELIEQTSTATSTWSCSTSRSCRRTLSHRLSSIPSNRCISAGHRRLTMLRASSATVRALSAAEMTSQTWPPISSAASPSCTRVA